MINSKASNVRVAFVEAEDYEDLEEQVNATLADIAGELLKIQYSHRMLDMDSGLAHNVSAMIVYTAA